MPVTLTPHARERLVERGGRIFEALALEAFDKGTTLSEAERQVMFDRGCNGKNYWSSTYRKHLGLIWVFRTDKGKKILLTVLPEGIGGTK